MARVAKYMGIPVTVCLPGNIDDPTRKRIASEGATVEIVDGTYDDAVQTVIGKGKAGEGLLVMDHSWIGYTRGSLELSGYRRELRCSLHAF